MTVQPLLEVIALGPRDAEAAQEGGADRLELVAEMALDGLTPADEVVRDTIAATDLPVRVMLRDSGSFEPADLDQLRARARRLVELGVREFVFGFLHEGTVDTYTCRQLLKELDGASWTFHRAVDHARDVRGAYRLAADLGCDTILTAGHPDGLNEGRAVVERRMALGEPPVVMAGGGLQPGHVAPLLAAGVRAFHVGSGVRPGGWAEPVSAVSVRRWVDLLQDS